MNIIIFHKYIISKHIFNCKTTSLHLPNANYPNHGW